METVEAVEFDPEVQPEAEVLAESPPKKHRKRGRPPATESSKPPAEASESGEPFPLPPRSSVKGGNISETKFFPYWADLTEQFRERCSVYIYRQWPALDHMLALTEEERMQVRRHERKKPATYITKYLSPFESTDWKSEILRRHGSGDYKLYLNDTGVRSNKSLPPRTICKCAVSLRDEDFPPVIEDTRIIDRADPVNAAFLEKLRLTGNLDNYTGEDEDMVQAQVNAQSNSAVETLAATVKDLAKDAREGNKQQQQPQSDPGSSAASKVVEVLGNAAIQGQGIIMDGFKAVQEMQSKAADPVASITPIVELMKSLIPPPPAPGPPSTASTDMLNMFKEMLTVQREASASVIQNMQQQLDATRQMHKEALDRLVTNGPTVNGAQTPQQSPEKFLDSMISLKEKFDNLTGGGEESGIPGWGVALMKIGEMAINGATNFMHNYAVMKTGQGQPIAPPEISGELPEGQAEQQQQTQNAIYARQFHEPMKDALTRKMHGSEFGARLCLQLGNTQAYDFLQSQGREGLMELLQAAPEVWGTFVRFGKDDQNITFLDQFLDRDAVYQMIETLKERANPKPTGRTVIGSDGKPMRTAGPVVNATAEPA